MKHLISSVTIGACLLLSSAGAVFAANPHGGPAMGMGQLGTGGTGAASCGGTQLSPPGQVGNATTNSPFPSVGSPPAPNPTGAVSKYAGAGNGNYGAQAKGTPN